MDSLDSIREAVLGQIASASDADALEAVRVAVLGRNGQLTALLKGLGALTPQEIARFDADNGAYRARFGFPFVICAREHTKASILAALAKRCANERAAEIATALAEIAKIARLRLEDAVN